MTYLDTGLLCSLYSMDTASSKAAALVKRHRGDFPHVWLHQLEFRNALRLRVFRREITAKQRDASLNLLLADLAAGVFQHASPGIQEVMTEAERLSAMHSESLGTRTLDVLHVAAAAVLGVERFLTLDKRQWALAKAAGFKVNAL